MEEIIIDGVDVAGCINYYKKDGSCMSGDCECTLCIHNDCTYKQLKRLEQENAKLKEEIEIRDNLSEKFRKEALSWANIANGYQKDKTKLKQTLQEIKAIAEKTIDIYYPDYYDEGFEEDIVTEFAKQVLDLITKAEEE